MPLGQREAACFPRAGQGGYLECKLLYYLYTITHQSVQDEEAEALHCTASHKCSKSAPSTRNDRCKQRHISAAQGLVDVKTAMGGAMEVLTAAIRNIANSGKNNVYSNVIATVVKDEAFSQNNMDDAFDIFTNNPQVAKTYAAIPDEGARSCYLQKHLSKFQAEKYGGIRLDKKTKIYISHNKAL